MRGWQYRSLNKGLQLLPCMHGDNLNKNNIVGLRKILEHYFVTRTIDYKSGLIFPLTHLLGRPYGSAGDLIFLPVMFFFISPPLLRAPSADRPETLPRDRKLAEFYNAGPKIRGLSPQKIWGPKTSKVAVDFIQFYTTSDFDREYLWNGLRYPTSEIKLIENNSSCVL